VISTHCVFRPKLCMRSSSLARVLHSPAISSALISHSRRIRITHNLITQLPPVSRYLPHPRSYYYLFSNILCYVSPSTDKQYFNTVNTTGTVDEITCQLHQQHVSTLIHLQANLKAYNSKNLNILFYKIL